MSRSQLDQGLINHVALVLDASSSMHHLTRDVIKVADEQIRYLARRSQELDQETRVTVYVFGTDVECVVYDKDALRLPSIAEYYRPNGCTALIDATMKSQDDLAETGQLYGDHAFLTFVVTDGQQYQPSRSPMEIRRATQALRDRLDKMPENWTVAVLVPDAASKHEAKQFGFQADNISIWDTTSRKGLEEGFASVRQGIDNFMTGRASGIRGTRAVFSTGTDAVNSQTVKALTPLDPAKYQIVHATNDGVMRHPQIRDWVIQEAGHTYRTGMAFYELTKSEKIQPQKRVAIMDKKTKQVYSDDQARDLLGLPMQEVRVKPDFNPDYSIFIQSTSTNRKLVGNTRLLLMTG